LSSGANGVLRSVPTVKGEIIQKWNTGHGNTWLITKKIGVCVYRDRLLGNCFMFFFLSNSKGWTILNLTYHFV
jgi:hypothetical protein